MEVTRRLISDLNLDPNNARLHSQKNLEAIKASLTKFGQRKPIVVTHDGLVLAGNGTMEAAKSLGWDHIDVTTTPADWDLDTARAYALADNRSAELAEWDENVLAKQLLELIDVDFDIEALGFELPEPEIQPEPDDAPAITEVEHRTKVGQLWKLGDHLLYCGDSTEESTFTRLMGDEKAHLIWTDPPWNVNYGGIDNDNVQGWKVRTILNDHMSEGQWDEFVNQFCKTLFDFSEPGAPIYLVMSAQEWPVIDRNLREAGFHWSSTVIWAKDRLVLSRKDYHTQYEPIWYGWNADAARLTPVEDRKQSDLWEIQRPARSELHPTMKPIELVQKSIVNSSKPGDIVIDSFGGSGSTLIACEQTNRKCRMVELDPQYCDVILARWEKFTGKTAELVQPE
jgi:DNA modification methylase